ncbi:MAG: phosphate ABC transporter permease subunit PstC [Oscillospiraceae bacterium]|jgi:phosphate transport system permease protein|nr:phosphate ABC transporter permease subunit PstC [Oscillospiraceae bacterium]
MKHKQFAEGPMRALFFAAACVSIFFVVLICAFLLASGVPAIGKIGLFRFLTGVVWRPRNGLYGIFPFLLGSVYVTAGAILVGVPVGVLTAVYLARFCPKAIAKLLDPAISLLAGTPSIIFGFFGLVVLTPLTERLFGAGKSILTASLLLGIMILPTVISVSASALRAVPQSYYEGALALGATPERSMFFSVIPAAKSGIMAAIVLGVSRAVGETMAVMMVAGNSTAVPAGIASRVRTLTTHIAIEMGYAEGLHRDSLIATAVVLLVLILIIYFLLSLIKKEK